MSFWEPARLQPANNPPERKKYHHHFAREMFKLFSCGESIKKSMPDELRRSLPDRSGQGYQSSWEQIAMRPLALNWVKRKEYGHLNQADADLSFRTGFISAFDLPYRGTLPAVEDRTPVVTSMFAAAVAAVADAQTSSPQPSSGAADTGDQVRSMQPDVFANVLVPAVYHILASDSVWSTNDPTSIITEKQKVLAHFRAALAETWGPPIVQEVFKFMIVHVETKLKNLNNASSNLQLPWKHILEHLILLLKKNLESISGI